MVVLLLRVKCPDWIVRLTGRGTIEMAAVSGEPETAIRMSAASITSNYSLLQTTESRRIRSNNDYLLREPRDSVVCC
jgi:hypothetical protein